MSKWQVELQDGRRFVVEADNQPTEQEVMGYLSDTPASRGVTGEIDKPRFEGFGQEILENLKEAGQETLGGAANLANTAGFGVPEILSQKIRGEGFVPEGLDPQTTSGTSALGFATGPMALARGGAKGASALLSKVPSTGLPGIIKAGITGATGGGLALGSQLPTPEEAPDLRSALEQIWGKTKMGLIWGAIAGAGTKLYSNIRNYSPNTVRRIQAKWHGENSYPQQQYAKYGKALDNLPSERINGSRVIERLEGELINKGLMNQDGTILRGGSSADRKLLKAYQNLSTKWASSQGGILDSRDIINEYKGVKGAFTKSISSAKRENLKAADSIINSAKDQFKSGAFQKLQNDYKGFKQTEELVHKYFGVKNPNPLLTSRGEATLTGRLKGTGEAETLKRAVQQTTGESLAGGVTLTKLNQIIKSPITRLLAYAGGGTALYKLLGKDR